MVVNRGRSAATVRQYTRAANGFFSWAEAGGYEINSDGVREWLRHLYFEKGCFEASTRAGKLSGLRTVCGWLVARGHLQANPANGVESPTFHAKAARKLDSKTLALLLTSEPGITATSIRNKAIMLLLYATGIRRAELCGLTLERLTMATTTGRVHITGKGNKQRVVGFSGKPVIDALNRWLIARCEIALPDEHAVFVAVSGLTPGKGLGFDGLRRVLKRSARMAGIKEERVHLHLLRSTFATDLYDQGVPVKEIALLLGHSDESTTWRRYIAISDRHLKKAVISSARWQALGVK